MTSPSTSSTTMTTSRWSTTLEIDIDAELEPEIPVATVVAPEEAAKEEDEEDDVVDLDEELHPDDVEEPLDVLLQERTASATLEDDEDEIEEEERDADDRGEGPTRIVPRRPGRVPLLVVLPRPAPEPARGRGADALPRLRVTTPPPKQSRSTPGPRPAAVHVGTARSGSGSRSASRPACCWPRRSRRSTSACSRWSRSSHCSGRGAARHRDGPRSTASSFGLAFFGLLLEWSRYFGAVAIVPLVVAEAAYWRPRGRSSRASSGEACARPRSSPRCGWSSRPCAGVGRSAGFPGVRSASRSTTSLGPGAGELRRCRAGLVPGRLLRRVAPRRLLRTPGPADPGRIGDR